MHSYRDTFQSDGSGKQYDALYADRVDSLVWRSFVKPFVRSEMMRAYDLGARRYLDFACGTGRLLKIGHEVFGHSMGIDISTDMLTVAQNRVPAADVVCLDVTRDAQDEHWTFDFVTMFRFLLNAEDDLRLDVLSWIHKHMAKGGTLVVNNHCNRASFGGMVKCARNMCGGSYNVLSIDRTVEMLEQAGFQTTCVEGYRIVPSHAGRPMLGTRLQVGGELLGRALGLGRFGMEVVVVAQRK